MASLKFFPVYVNHIANTVNAADIRSLFSRLGSVIDVIIVEDYGFVNMLTEEDAFAVIDQLNGRGLHASLLHVDFSEEMKHVMLQRGVRFRCTPDPYTGIIGAEHPPYPSGEGIESPLAGLDHGGGVSMLMDSKEYLDERLRMINAELERMKQSEAVGIVAPSRSRSPLSPPPLMGSDGASRIRGQLRSRSRGRRRSSGSRRRSLDRAGGRIRSRTRSPVRSRQRRSRSRRRSRERGRFARRGRDRSPSPPRRLSSSNLGERLASPPIITIYGGPESPPPPGLLRRVSVSPPAQVAASRVSVHARLGGRQRRSPTPKRPRRLTNEVNKGDILHHSRRSDSPRRERSRRRRSRDRSERNSDQKRRSMKIQIRGRDRTISRSPSRHIVMDSEDDEDANKERLSSPDTDEDNLQDLDSLEVISENGGDDDQLLYAPGDSLSASENEEDDKYYVDDVDNSVEVSFLIRKTATAAAKPLLQFNRAVKKEITAKFGQFGQVLAVSVVNVRNEQPQLRVQMSGESASMRQVLEKLGGTTIGGCDVNICIKSGDLTASRRARENEALADWADTRDIVLRAVGFITRPTQRSIAELFSPFGIVRDISFKKRQRLNVIVYLTLLGSARRAYRACRALSAHTQSNRRPPQITFSGRNTKDVTAINGLLMAYKSRYKVVVQPRQQTSDRPRFTSVMLHVGWLLQKVTTQQVADFFREYGNASLVKTMINRSAAGHARTFACVNLRTESRERAIEACVDLTGTMLGGSMVEVSCLKKNKGHGNNKRVIMQEEVERRLREKIRSQLPSLVNADTANERIELVISGLDDGVNREQLVLELLPFGLAVEGPMDIKVTEEGRLNITLLTTPDTAISACKVLTGEKICGHVVAVEVADTLAQQQLRMRYLEARGQDPTTDDEIKKFILFVGGIKVPMTKLEVRSIFEPYGNPIVSEIGVATNRGYVFIDLRTTEARAIQACLELSAEEFFGNRLKVEFKDRPGQEHLVAATRQLVGQKLTQTRWKRKQTWDKVERGEQVPAVKQREEEETDQGDAVKKYQLYVDGIRQPMTSAQLGELFRPYGQVGRLAVMDDRFFTFVDLETTQERAIAACLELSGREVCGNLLRVQFSKRSGQERITQLMRMAAAQLEVVQPGGEMTAAYAEGGYFSSYPEEGGDAALLPSSAATTSLNDDSILPRLNIPNPVAPRTVNENLIESFVKATRQDAEKQLNQDTRAARSWAEWVRGGEDASGQDPTTTISADFLKNIMDTVASSSSAGGAPRQRDEGPKAARRFRIAGLSSRINDFDLKDLLVNYGTISRIDSKITCAYVQAYMSEYMAVKCVCELNGYFIKGCRLMMEFVKGSFEESKEFREKWADEFKLFSSAEHKATLVNMAKPIPKMSFSEIGEGLKNIDMSLNLEPVHPSFQKPSESEATSSQYAIDRQAEEVMRLYGHRPANPLPALPSFTGCPPPTVQPSGGLYPSRASTSESTEVSVLTNIQGKIHSIQNKQILLEFSSPALGAEKVLAKLIPGQMYINGKQCLGFAIKSNTYHTWPQPVKEFMQIGKELCMDLKRLSVKEMHDAKDRERSVQWTAPLVWLPGFRPTEKEMSVSAASLGSRLATATITMLHPSWGLLRCQEEQIIFTVDKFFLETSPLKKDASLFKVDVEVKDIVAVHFQPLKVDLAEYMQQIPQQHRPLDNLQGVRYEALLVWQVSAEVDPWVYTPANQEKEPSTVSFLITSSTLNRTLPGDKEAELMNLSGVVEEIHLPAGGIIKLSEESLATIGIPAPTPQQQRVYFHRSRVHLNGSKIQSDQSLDRALLPGDQVSLDLVRNCPNPEDPPYVMSGAFWIALAVRANTVARGVQLANRLRKEASSGVAEGAVAGRVVHLAPPDDPLSPVVQGVAVITTGEFLGQRVEFDRSVCLAYGFPLAKADLSHIIGTDEAVFMKLKSYNSYCVEKLWIGFSGGARREGGLDPEQRAYMRQELERKGISQAGFDLLIKGQFSPRNFIPLRGQAHQGTVVSLHEEDSLATSLTIQCSSGEVISAQRTSVYCYGHWMGKADLAYCLQGERVFFEVPPRYSQEDQDYARLVWLGARPEYRGMATEPYIAEQTTNSLKLWLASKRLDLHIFRALVDGVLPSKKKTEQAAMKAGSSEISLDPDTLAQAAMLQKLKSQVGSEKMLNLMMDLLKPEARKQAGHSESGQQQVAASMANYASDGMSSSYYSSRAQTATHSSSPKPGPPPIPPTHHQPPAPPTHHQPPTPPTHHQSPAPPTHKQPPAPPSHHQPPTPYPPPPLPGYPSQAAYGYQQYGMNTAYSSLYGVPLPPGSYQGSVMMPSSYSAPAGQAYYQPQGYPPPPPQP